MDKISLPGELPLLERILAVFSRDPEHPLNYSQLSRELKLNRQLITGTLNILQGIGLIKCVNQCQTNKLFLLNLPLDYKQLIQRIHRVINPQNKNANFDLMPLLEAEQALKDEIRSLSRDNLQLILDCYEDEWVSLLDPLLDLVLRKDQIQQYYDLLHKKDPVTLHRQLLEDYYGFRLGGRLPSLFRGKLVVIFKEIFEYGLTHFDKPFLLNYLKRDKDQS